MSNPPVGDAPASQDVKANDGQAGQTSIQARSAALHDFADHSMSRGQAREAVLTDLETLTRLRAYERSTALGTMGRIAESQRAYGAALAQADPVVSDQALATSKRQDESIVRAQTEYRQSPEGIAAAPQADRMREAVRTAEVQHDGWRADRSFAALGPTAADRSTAPDAQYLKVIESRHDGLQTVPVGALDIKVARDAAMQDVRSMNVFSDKSFEGRAASVMGDTADQHPTYKAALRELAPHYADLAVKAFEDDQQKSAAKEDRKSFEFEGRRDDAAQAIATRYANMEQAGLSVKDLQGPAVERLAVMDSRDLLLLEGQPAHRREGEAKALAAQSMKNDAYRATFTRETAAWSMSAEGWKAGVAANVAKSDPMERAASSSAPVADRKQTSKDPVEPGKDGIASNSMRPAGGATEKRRAIPPLEDRFNVFRTGLIEKEYRFRDQAGTVAFTDKLWSINSTSESPAAIKAMVDRAAERGWETVRLKGSPEFLRQGWIAANTQGIKAVGHTPTSADREAVAKERTRLDVGHAAEGSHRQAEGVARSRAEQGERSQAGPAGRTASATSGQRQLATAIEKALSEGKVSPEIRGQVRDLMAAEGARRIARGDRFKLPVYDAQAPRARGKTLSTGPQRLGDRERSR